MITIRSKVFGRCRPWTSSRTIETSAGDDAAEQQREAEEQGQGDGAADHLGDVGGHGHGLGLQPVGVLPGRAEPVTEQLGKGLRR